MNFYDFLPSSVRRYLDDVFSLLFSQLGTEKVVALYIFGSMVDGEGCDISDLDLLVVLDDGVTSGQIKRINGLLESLAIKYELVSRDSSFIGGVLRVIEKDTGMFISHFVSRKRDVEGGSFSQVFSTNRLMSKLLSPSSIVFGSVLSRAKKIYGEDVLSKTVLSKPTVLTLIKSLAMNLCLSLFSLVLYPLTSKATMYEMEAAKWSVLASYYFLKKKNPGLIPAIKFLTNLKLPETFFKRLLQLRSNYQKDIFFGLVTPFYVLKTHFKALNYRKIFQ
ncbi:MAG: nucleotidyltransferase domain-containing protein [Candidatus Jordarchaeum sp.]|uniref:nucleotidyltransferase domain-containing protein n=1 Tax=Candidatus Jordarchaeum sp. TaxID=2823881 RepID=UPI00404AEEB2